jgi:uncharacterized protein (TIGR02444 family)
MALKPNGAAAGEDLWRFSLALYARPGVAASLIALQDRAGCDVNLMLYALWLGVRGVRLDEAGLAAAAAAIAPINIAAVAPLRRLRRQLRGNDDPLVASLRPRVLGLELAAERQVQYRLAVQLPVSAMSEHEADGLGIAAANLARYVGSAHREPEVAVLLQGLAALTRG